MKRKLLLIILLIASGIAKAQIINIPDTNFKNALLMSSGIAQDSEGNSIVIDTNNDNEIQETEALQVIGLDVSAQDINSLTGIEYFTNLEHLYCTSNNISVLDVSALPGLTTLSCSNNEIIDLDITGLDNLIEIDCASNNLTAIDISDAVALQFLNCNENQLSALDLSTVSNLVTLECNNNLLTEIDFSVVPDIIYIDCSNNQIPSIDISSLENLEGLICAYNLLTALDISDVNNLSGLDCGHNQISALDFSATPKVHVLECSYNLLTELDLSGTLVYSLSCSHNNIASINLKNGVVHSDVSDWDNSWSENPLTYLCADEDELEIINDLLEVNNYTDINVNTYCSFTPGGDYNTITGILTYDLDNDGCDVTDPAHSFIKMNVTDGTNSETVFTGTTGNYNFYTGAGEFTVTPQFENNYFSASPANITVNFPTADSSIATEDFCITSDGEHADIEVVMIPVGPAQPGMDALYKIIYKNKGNTVLSGGVSCEWNDALLEFVSINPMADVIGAGTYTWYFNNLQPFENREILMTLNVNTPTDIPAVNIGDVLPFTADVVIVGDDENPADNNFLLDQVVVGSYPSNSITCIQGDTEPAENIGEYLHYIVNFANTGNATANSVVVRHEIDESQFEIASLQLLNSSHEVSARVEENIIEFVFNNINLSVADHGNILFKVKSKSSLMANDMVTNNANIYFDYNAPIQTNDANTTFEALAGSEVELDNTIGLYPNPSKGVATITANTTILSIQVYDIQGRLLQVNTANDTTAKLDLSAQPSDLYFVKITTEKGVKVEKLIKE
ncbi:T9SS type A sorting domain-containing protein [Flavobacterium salilacus subsp. salilacus]|uniref:DUF7619 domain-containing protein n=1 Tax=Flavobacterium TaxID=237 RepID=UPI0010752A60|nr:MULTISPECIES: T9SS type A sorting domain-containing protein [Flavobacterium]KAF2519799.1 T9SS type A sorting domain-containing protein [Flavobacterium salilacus subsp. salilacus]MBE1614302.1 leucine-rich repeat domain-containing protein [Flavobacterium sp. SaA2.13]